LRERLQHSDTALCKRGKIVLFSDADLSAPVTELPKLVMPFFATIVTSLWIARNRSVLIGVHQSRFREISGMIFNLLVQLTIGLPYKDTQCGFKAFEAGSFPRFLSGKRSWVLGLTLSFCTSEGSED
jgi:hypothetical protein